MQNRRGFTLIELITAIMVGAILVTIGVSAFGTVSRRFAAREARNTFASMHARARAQAIEFGETMAFRTAATGDSVWIERSGITLETLRLGNELQVDLISSPDTVTLCFNSRGYGDTGCSSFSSAVTYKFAAAADTFEIQMLPLGQLIF